MNYQSPDKVIQSYQANLFTWYMSPQKTSKFLLKIIAALIMLNLTEKEVIHWLNTFAHLQLSPHYFDFNTEGNFPALYSALALGLCSFILAMTSRLKKSLAAKDHQSWMFLSFIFLCLAFDEFCSVHELLNPILRKLLQQPKGWLYFPWVTIGLAFTIIFLIFFRKFIYNLPSKIRTLLLIAGGLYLMGALGLEMINGYIVESMGFDNLVYGIISTIAELLEMLGVVIFIHGLLVYIQFYIWELNFPFSLQKPSH